MQSRCYITLSQQQETIRSLEKEEENAGHLFKKKREDAIRSKAEAWYSHAHLRFCLLNAC